MLQAFIIALREGVEAALMVGITLAYLAKIGRNDLRKSVYAALGAAFLGSIAVAVVISRTNLNEDVFEGWIMLAAAFFVITMVIFMMKTGRKLKGEIEGKLGLLAGNDAWFGLFIFVFLMVLREGAETVLMLAAVSLNSTALMSFLGTLLGIFAAIAFGVMFVKGSVRINLQKFFRVTTAILFLVAVQLIIAGLHELSESGVLPSSRREMAIIGPSSRLVGRPTNGRRIAETAAKRRPTKNSGGNAARPTLMTTNCTPQNRGTSTAQAIWVEEMGISFTTKRSIYSRARTTVWPWRCSTSRSGR